MVCLLTYNIMTVYCKLNYDDVYFMRGVIFTVLIIIIIILKYHYNTKFESEKAFLSVNTVPLQMTCQLFLNIYEHQFFFYQNNGSYYIYTNY